jgi:hypothetical protein
MDTDFQEADHVLPHASGLMVEGHEHLSPILRFANPGKNNYAATARFETALKREGWTRRPAVVTKSQVNGRVNSVTEKEIVNAIAQSGVAMEEPR